MNRTALALAVLGAPGLVAVSLVASSDLVPAGVAPGLAGLGGVLALGGVVAERTRVHGAGVALAVVGASLAGVALPRLAIALGVASTALLVGSLNLHLNLGGDRGGPVLAATAILAAVLVAALALGLARLGGELGGGGIDAAGGVAAWLALVAAGTWGLARWVGRAETG